MHGEPGWRVGNREVHGRRLEDGLAVVGVNEKKVQTSVVTKPGIKEMNATRVGLWRGGLVSKGFQMTQMLQKPYVCLLSISTPYLPASSLPPRLSFC